MYPNHVRLILARDIVHGLLQLPIMGENQQRTDAIDRCYLLQDCAATIRAELQRRVEIVDGQVNNKAAFYDRSAHMGPERRISIAYRGDDARAVMDGDRELFACPKPTNWEAPDLAREWADKHFPNWRSAAAYWDLDDIMDVFEKGEAA